MINWIGWSCAVARVGDGRGDFGSRGLAAPYRTPLYQFVCLCLRHACTVVAPPLNGRWSRARVRPRQRSVCNTCAASAGDDARGAADSVNWYPPRASCPPPSVVELRSPLREQRTRDGSFRIRVYINLPSQWSYPSCATLCTTDLLLKPAQPLTIVCLFCTPEYTTYFYRRLCQRAGAARDAPHRRPPRAWEGLEPTRAAPCDSRVGPQGPSPPAPPLDRSPSQRQSLSASRRVALSGWQIGSSLRSAPDRLSDARMPLVPSPPDS